ncbi:unnamed protein product [Moneuplotes crassus]|uniref:Uncharacterized protein n=1 Tax=Euplotes crassus TaxID=5936 RepID=A0AAD1XMU9_EUPCR|nr:unnamed protein product [Moneuplotes crassus]
MNLKQIERRFDLLDKREKYVNYYYNPLAQPIPGLKQSCHIKELKRDAERDIPNYGLVSQNLNSDSKGKLKPYQDSNNQFKHIKSNIKQYMNYAPRSDSKKDNKYEITGPQLKKIVLPGGSKNSKKHHQDKRFRDGMENSLMDNTLVGSQSDLESRLKSAQRADETEYKILIEGEKRIHHGKVTFKKFTTSANSREKQKRIMNSSALVNLNKIIHKKQGLNESMRAPSKCSFTTPITKFNLTQTCGTKQITAEPSQRIKKNSIIGKELTLYESQLNGRFKKRICSAKPLKRNHRRVYSEQFNIPQHSEDKSYIVNNTEYDQMRLIVNRTPRRAPKVHKVNIDTESPKEVLIPGVDEHFLYKIRLPEGIKSMTENFEIDIEKDICLHMESELFTVNVKICMISQLTDDFKYIEFIDCPIRSDLNVILCPSEEDPTTLNPSKHFPWVKDREDIENQTFQVRVTFCHYKNTNQTEEIMSRFVHFGKLNKEKLCKIYLQIGRYLQSLDMNSSRKQSFTIPNPENIIKNANSDSRISLLFKTDGFKSTSYLDDLNLDPKKLSKIKPQGNSCKISGSDSLDTMSGLVFSKLLVELENENFDDIFQLVNTIHGQINFEKGPNASQEPILVPNPPKFSKVNQKALALTVADLADLKRELVRLNEFFSGNQVILEFASKIIQLHCHNEFSILVADTSTEAKNQEFLKFIKSIEKIDKNKRVRFRTSPEKQASRVKTGYNKKRKNLTSGFRKRILSAHQTKMHSCKSGIRKNDRKSNEMSHKEESQFIPLVKLSSTGQFNYLKNSELQDLLIAKPAPKSTKTNPKASSPPTPKRPSSKPQCSKALYNHFTLQNFPEDIQIQCHIKTSKDSKSSKRSKKALDSTLNQSSLDSSLHASLIPIHPREPHPKISHRAYGSKSPPSPSAAPSSAAAPFPKFDLTQMNQYTELSYKITDLDPVTTAQDADNTEFLNKPLRVVAQPARFYVQ